LERAWLNARHSNQMEVAALGERIKRLQKHQANVHADIAIRQDTSGEKFGIVLGNQTFTERKTAGFEVLRLAQHFVSQLNHNDARVIGSIGGFKVQLRRAFFEKKQASIEFVGNALYESELSDTPLGVIASLENQLRRLEEKLASTEASEAESAQRLTQLQRSLNDGFQHADRLTQLRQKQAALNEELQSSRGETMAVSDESSIL